MQIKVGNLFLLGDKYGYSIGKELTRNRKGEVVTEIKPFAWFTSIEGAIRYLVDYRVRTADVQTLADALAEVKRASAEACAALQPRFEVRQVSE